MAIVFVAAGVQDISRSIPRWHPKAVDLEMLWFMFHMHIYAIRYNSIINNWIYCIGCHAECLGTVLDAPAATAAAPLMAPACDCRVSATAAAAVARGRSPWKLHTQPWPSQCNVLYRIAYICIQSMTHNIFTGLLPYQSLLSKKSYVFSLLGSQQTS